MIRYRQVREERENTVTEIQSTNVYFLCERVRTTVISWSLVSGCLAAKGAEALGLYTESVSCTAWTSEAKAQSLSSVITLIKAGAAF